MPAQPRMKHRTRMSLPRTTLLLACLLAALPVWSASKPAPAPAPRRLAPPAVLEAWKQAGFRFTPELEASFLDSAKAVALRQLADAGKTLPADFLAWVDADPAIRTTVYGARQDPAGLLLILRSLELDLGQEVVRKKYTQLALAMAVVHAKDGDQADLVPRAPLVLHIGGDPRKLVDTHATNRPLDLDDHIINFLNDHAPIVEDVVVGHKEVLPELVYDDQGQAVPQKNAKPKKEPIIEKRPRPLRAADVIASAELEKEFNAYLKEHGQTNQLHCGGETRLHWKSTDTKGIDAAGTKAAYELFVHAYKAKGYLPPEPDPVPTLAERCAFLIRNHESPVVTTNKSAVWPKFPLNAPWPVLTFLAADAQPLRERQDIWERYRDKGEFHGYGEYVGSIAQTPIYLQARRVAPFAFNYGSVQMMLKDGGVCGVMANIAVRSHQSLGTPASTAGQPGHCALVRFAFDDNRRTYACVGGQYATAGDAGTGVHVPWYFGDVDARRPMVYHQSVAWAANFGLQAFLDSTVAHTLFKQLPDADCQAHGMELLQSAAALCPYNFLLVEDALASDQPAPLVAFWQNLQPLLASGKPGCPTNGLYNQTIQEKLFARLAALPVPTESRQAEAIFAFLRDEKCPNQSTLIHYQVALHGLPTVLAGTEASFKHHLASARTDADCALMADALSATAAKITDKPQRAQWALARWQELQGRELYLGKKHAFTADKAVAVLAKLAGQKPRPEPAQVQSLLDQLTAQLKAETAAARTPQGCKQLAAVLTATAGQLKDAGQKRQWLEGLAQIIAGKESYQVPNAKPNAKPLRDPCADAIGQLLKSEGPPRAA
jgi:hypothetical protein